MKLLTRRKTKWVERRKPDLIRGGVMSNPSIVEARYNARLQSLVQYMLDETEKQIRQFFREPHTKEYFAQDASVGSQARIMMNALMRQLNALYAERAPQVAGQMANAADKASSSAFHSAVQKLSGGLSIQTTQLTGDLNEVFTASVAENVALIKSISQQYLTGVQGAVMRSITTGRGFADLEPFLEKHKGITRRKAELIARDQVKKTYEGLNTGRMERAGLDKYIWRHSGGSQHPRKDHIAMSGKVYSLSDPPIIDERTGQRGGPGDAINCNCRKELILLFND
jgi:uncharacterized protein with gpF-like domain